MDDELQTNDRLDDTAGTGRRRRIRGRSIAAALITLASTGASPTQAQTVVETAPCCEPVAAPAEQRLPDAVADYIGGIAARVRHTGGATVPGDLFLLMATAGSTATARLFDATPYVHEQGDHADTSESNRLAAATAGALVDTDVEPIELTSAPGGGPSGGLVYLLTYLNVVSDGAFTGDVRVAATGELTDEGYLEPITAATEKLPAARLAGVDVLFTTSVPSTAALEAHADRAVGERFRSRRGAVTLQVERQLHEYEAWGADAPDGLDVVVVGHVADVAAYLCGAGSAEACGVRDRLADTVTSDELTAFDLARLADTGSPSTEVVLGSPGVGTLQ